MAKTRCRLDNWRYLNLPRQQMFSTGCRYCTTRLIGWLWVTVPDFALTVTV